MSRDSFELTGGPCHWDIHFLFFLVVSHRYARHHGLRPDSRRLRRALARLSKRITEAFHDFFNPELDWDRRPERIEGEWKLYEFGDCPCSFHIDIQVRPLPAELGRLDAEEVLRNLPEHTGILQIDRINMTEHPHADIGGKKVVIDEDHVSGGSTFPHELGHILGLPDLYRTGLPGNEITKEEEERYKGTLMGKKGRMGRRKVTKEDMQRIADQVGMTCEMEECCPDKDKKRKKGEKRREKGVINKKQQLDKEISDRDEEGTSTDAQVGLSPVGAVMDFFSFEDEYND